MNLFFFLIFMSCSSPIKLNNELVQTSSYKVKDPFESEKIEVNENKNLNEKIIPFHLIPYDKFSLKYQSKKREKISKENDFLIYVSDKKNICIHLYKHQVKLLLPYELFKFNEKEEIFIENPSEFQIQILHEKNYAQFIEIFSKATFYLNQFEYYLKYQSKIYFLEFDCLGKKLEFKPLE